MPNIDKFRELKEEDYEGSLDIFMAWDSVKAKFLMLEAEAPHGKKVPDGLFAEMMYDFVFGGLCGLLARRHILNLQRAIEIAVDAQG